MIEIVIPGTPISWKAPYVGSRGAYSPRTPIMDQLRALLRAKYKGPYFEEPIDCNYYFYMPIPKCTSKKRKKLMIEGEIRPSKVPDRDNLAKFTSDLLQGVFYPNDSLIVGGRVEKWYAEIPRTVVKISRSLNNNQNF